MFSRELVHAPLQRLSEPEIVAVQGQDFLVIDRVEHPVRELDLDLLHAPVPGLAHDGGAIDDAEDVELFRAAGDDVGLDLRAL